MKNYFSALGKYDCRIPGFVFLLTFILYLPYVFFQEFLLRDTALRYAPMAEAFARGDWLYAFHPRVQCLHPIVSGCFVWIFDCSGFVGVQLSALLVFALCAFPLYFLLKTVFDRNIALWGTLCLPLVSPVVLISVTGLREPYKILAILLLIWGAVTVYLFRESWRGYLLTGLGGGLAFVIRNDLIPPALLICLLTGVMEFAVLKTVKRSAGAFLLVCLFAGIECTINYAVCRYAVLGPSTYVLFQKIFKTMPGPAGIFLYVVLPGSVLYFAGICLVGTLSRFRCFKCIFVIFLCLLGAGLIFRIIQLIPGTPSKEIMRFFHSLLRGVNFLLLPAGFGIFYQKKTKKWTAAQALLLGLFLLLIFSPVYLIVFLEKQLYVSYRYLLPATPLLLGWAVVGIAGLWNKLKSLLPSPAAAWVMPGLAAVLAGACLFHAYSRLWEEKFDRKEVRRLKKIRRMAEIFRTRYQGEKTTVPRFNIHFYQSNLRPKIFFADNFSGKETCVVYLAGGSLCRQLEEADFVVSVRPPVPGKWKKGEEGFSIRKKEWYIWQRR